MTHAAARGELHVVAVAPDAGKPLEVGIAILAAVGIVPEADRHRRERRRADQLALLADHRRALIVVDLDLAGRARGTGSRRATPAASGLPSTKHDTMSVPPEIDDSSRSCLIEA